MIWVDQLRDTIPEYAKDISLNLDAVINRSTLDPEFATALSLSAAIATGNDKLAAFIKDAVTDPVERSAAFTAAALMAQNNVWYPYVEMTGDANLKGLPAQLRMNSISSHGGTTKLNFESYSLISSIIGKCHFCVKAHYETLKQEGLSVEQLRDIGRIAAVINSVAKVLNAPASLWPKPHYL
jgi:alkyl hydroperoxide reductase subunit D